MRNLTSKQIESIVLDAAVVIINDGEADAKEIGITKGGVEFAVTESVRDIEYDGRRGKTKGMEVVDGIDAYLKFTTLELTNDNILHTLGAAELNENTIKNTVGGVVPGNKYIKNVAAYGICNKTNSYKKIKIYNASGAGQGLSIKTTDKGEASIDLQFNAHWNPLDYSESLYTVEDANAMPTQGE